MSQKTTRVCDGCGTECENPYAMKGWIQISGSMTRAWGVYGESSYKTDFLESGLPKDHDFCSIGCIEKAFNKCRDREPVK